MVILIAFVTLVAPTAVGADPTPDDVGPESFITLQYGDFLNRAPDPGGLAFWSGRLRAGDDPALLIEAMVNSPEFGQVVSPLLRLYDAHLQRFPDLEGLRFWVGQLNSGATINSVSELFADSQEFKNKYGSLSDAEYVNRVYQNVLGREADAEGAAFWRGRLAAGMTRGALMVQFSESTENIRRLDGTVRATMLYLGLLNRVPEAEGVEYWAGEINRGVSYRVIMRSFLYSPEYRARLDRLFPQTHPLSGQATDALTNRSALAVKIDNVPQARPPVGVTQADLVVEEMVEGTFTRLIAIFQSNEPSVVGPVRSLRTTDFDVLSQLNRPLLAASGGNRTVLQLLESAPVVNVNALVAGGAYYRANDRRAPHNLFANTGSLRQAGGDRPGLPTQLFSYRDGDDPVRGARPSAGVDIDFGNQDVSYRWDDNRRSWLRTMNRTAHVDAGGTQIGPENVVVMVTDYRTSAADSESPEAVTVGSGEVFVFTGGSVVSGTWSRAKASDPIVFRDGTGSIINLTAGATWVALAPAGTITIY